MGIDPELRDFMKESRTNHIEMNKALGRLEEGQENMKAYIGAVSGNVKAVNERVDKHVEKHTDELKEEKKSGREWWGISATMGLVLLTAIEVWRQSRGH